MGAGRFSGARPNAGTAGHHETTFPIIPDAFVVVIRDVKMSFEIDAVGPRGEMRRRGGAQAGLNHAAEEDPEAMLARGGDHLDGAVETAAFQQLHVHPAMQEAKRATSAAFWTLSSA